MKSENFAKKLKKLKLKVGYFDHALLFIIIFLAGFGLIMIYSAGTSSAYFNNQLLSVIIGGVFMTITCFIDYKKYNNKKFAFGLYLFSLLCVLMLLTPLGKTVNGARRWLNFGFTTLQPSEIVKIGVIVLTAYIICDMAGSIIKIKYLARVWFFCGVIPAGLIYLISSNLSSAIIIFLIVLMMTFVAYPGYKPYVIIAVICLIGFLIVIIYASTATPDTSSWRANRVFVWLHPEDYAQDTGYQTVQSLYAIGSGGFFGKGLGGSLQKINYIPEAQNDMIFSIICEELGIFGAIFVIALYGILLWRLFVVATEAPTKFGMLLTMGIFFHIVIQVFLNIAVATNLLPNTGVTLPFISYGGSSVSLLMLELGVALNVSRHSKKFKTVKIRRKNSQDESDRDIQEANDSIEQQY